MSLGYGVKVTYPPLIAGRAVARGSIPRIRIILQSGPVAGWVSGNGFGSVGLLFVSPVFINCCE